MSTLLDKESKEEHNCPFYGRHMFIPQPPGRGLPFILINQSGNQCALVVSSYAPCIFTEAQAEIDWKTCPRVNDVRPN